MLTCEHSLIVFLFDTHLAVACQHTEATENLDLIRLHQMLDTTAQLVDRLRLLSHELLNTN